MKLLEANSFYCYFGQRHVTFQMDQRKGGKSGRIVTKMLRSVIMNIFLLPSRSPFQQVHSQSSSPHPEGFFRINPSTNMLIPQALLSFGRPHHLHRYLIAHPVIIKFTSTYPDAEAETDQLLNEWKEYDQQKKSYLLLISLYLFIDIGSPTRNTPDSYLTINHCVISFHSGLLFNVS